MNQRPEWVRVSGKIAFYVAVVMAAWYIHKWWFTWRLEHWGG